MTTSPIDDPAWIALIEASKAELDAADEADRIAVAMFGGAYNDSIDLIDEAGKRGVEPAAFAAIVKSCGSDRRRIWAVLQGLRS